METKNNNSEKLVKKRNTIPVKINDFAEISNISNKVFPNPFESLQNKDTVNQADFVEAIIFWYQEKYGNKNFIDAQNEFQKKTGKVFFGDQYYNERLAYFLDYFAFQRPCENSSEKSTPFKNFIASDFFKESNLNNNLREEIESLETHQHSAYEIIRVGKKIIIKDLFKKEKLEITGHGNNFFEKFHQGIIFQGFTFGSKKEVSISNGIIMHNPEATKYIKKSLRKNPPKSLDDRCDYLFQLANQNTKYGRMKNLAIKSAYSFNS